MKFKTTFKNLVAAFRGPVVWQLEEGHTIEPVFIAGGEQYYQLKDVFNTHCQRALEAIHVFEEWEQRTDKRKLIAFIDAMKDELQGKNGQVNLQLINEYVIRLEERTKWPIPTTEIINKMAAVAYFDKNENPYHYDESYCRKKIERWKKESVDAFFLYNHLKGLIALPDISVSVLAGALTVVDQMDHLQSLKLKNYLLKNSPKPVSSKP